MSPDPQWMRLAIDTARKGLAAGQTPFGACIVRQGQLVVAAHNIVWQSCDVTAHAEVHAIRDACAQLGTIDLSGCEIYSTCEPCPMCFSACHWARLDRIVFGASIADARQAGFNELGLSNERMKQLGGSSIQVVGGFLADEAIALFKTWLDTPQRRTY